MNFVHVHIKPKRHIFSVVNVGESTVMVAEDKWLLDLLWNLESTTCPRCLQLGHRVRECPAEAVTQYLSCCKQWKLHRPGCVRALDLKK
jgi:hypothetical protein